MLKKGLIYGVLFALIFLICGIGSSYAFRIHPKINDAFALAEGIFLDTVIDSVVCDLDATVSASYGGSGQTWANLIASPADSTSTADCDFWLGADNSSSTDDPTFTGSAGDAGAYFALDGGDWLDLKSLSAQTTLKNLHRTDEAGVWFVLAWHNDTLAQTRCHMGNSSGGSFAGFRALGFTDGKIDLYISNGTSNAIEDNVSGVLVDNTDYLMILSWDGTSSTNNVRFWLLSTTKNEQSLALNSSTTSATTIFSVGTGNSTLGCNALPNNTRIYHFSAGNEFLTEAKAEAIAQLISTRHNRSYLGLTP